MLSARIRLHLKKIVGEGEQGRVYEAVRHDPATNLRQTVAVKILHSRNAVDLWRKEFSSLVSVRSPYCVRVLSFERVRGKPALILEFVRGVSLAEWHRARLGSERCRDEILAQILCGLRDLRAHGSYHGDLSPNNVMIDDRGVVRLLDFGLANGHGDELRCTPEFAAPERLRGLPPDFSSDLYSLGQLRVFLGGTADGRLLDPEPHLRSAPGDQPDPDRAQTIARSINGYLSSHGRAANWVTQTLQKNSDSILTRSVACLGAIVFLSVPASPSVTRPDFGVLSVSTVAWHLIRLDGLAIGYAPFIVPLTSNRSHLLEWSSAKGTGRKQLWIRAGERRLITDRDFAP